MSDLRVNNITNSNGNSGPVIAGVATVSSNAFMIIPSGNTAVRGAGSGRGIIGGSFNPSPANIDKIEIATIGDATNFGSLKSGHSWSYPSASSTRGIYAGGYINPGSSNLTKIDYVIFSSGGGGNDFGDLRTALKQGAGFSDSTRGVFATGAGASPISLTTSAINFITMASTGTDDNFGDALAARRGAKGLASPTRGVFARGGYIGPGSTTDTTKVLEFVTIQSQGNSVKFGDRTTTHEFQGAAASNNVRGIFAGGFTSPANSDIIDYITIASEGNAIDFGDLTVSRHGGGGVSSATRAVFAGLWKGSANNIMDYVTIATTGDAVDFGDSTTTIYYSDGCSDVHGGLG